MTILPLVMGAVLYLAPAIGPVRATEIATGIVSAAGEDLPLALLLVTVDWGESSFRKSVQTCEVTGDGGRAVSAYQLHRHHWGRFTREEICASHPLASSLAVGALGKGLPPRNALARYLGRALTDPEVERRVRVFDSLMGVANG